MALQPGTGGGEYVTPDEWVALGRENALVAIVVTGHGTTHMTKGPSAGKDVDSAAFDLYILDGSRKGDVEIGQDAIGRGIVAPLKRVAVGEEVAYRVGVGQAYGKDYPQLNAPGELPQEAVDLFESLKGGTPAPKTNGAKAKVPAQVGGGNVTDDAIDDQPDF